MELIGKETWSRSKMKFLIPTEPDDMHAIVVKLALEKLGHQVTLIFTADQPIRQKNSVFVDIEHYRWQSVDRFDAMLDHDYDVVWWRRARKPCIPKGIAHAQDYRFVVRENLLFHESFTYNMAPNAWWINSKDAANRASFKLLQLKTASECGLTIPTTLCSNDPEEIRLFILKHAANGVIYKPLSGKDNPINIPSVSKITYLDLPSNQFLQRSPGIFQKEVKKQYELRVTCFGHYLVAAKLNVHKNQQLVIEPFVLPDDLSIKIRAFMHELGIVFGTCDFIVTPDDEYIFLELDEQGQFLWIEDLNPAFKMLDIFVNFLLSKSVDFKWDPNGCEHSIERYRSRLGLGPTINKPQESQKRQQTH